MGSVGIKSALDKLNQEIEKDIEKVVTMAKRGTWIETQYIMFILHLVRVLKTFPDISNYPNKSFLQTLCSVQEDAYKYALQLLVKYGNQPVKLDYNYIPLFQAGMMEELFKSIVLLNNKYDARSLVQLTESSLNEENPRYISLDMSELHKNPKAKHFFDYFLRLDIDNNIKHEGIMLGNDLIQALKKEFTPYKDLFEIEFGVTLNYFLEFIQFAGDFIKSNLLKTEQQIPILKNGNVDVLSSKSFFMYTSSITMDLSFIQKKFGVNIINIINRLLFDPTLLNDNELKYFLLTRYPLIKSSQPNMIVFSPELLLDSLFLNLHYSLLEGQTKNEYKKKYSEEFINWLVAETAQFGYVEVSRELDLFEGRNQIGDIDLILKNNENHYLLFEAKNHSLPLNVYLKEVPATEDRLNNLKNDWERKVKGRIAHLQLNYEKYNIGVSHTYLIVSNQPEVLSHFTDIPCFSRYEFKEWLKQGDYSIGFETMYEHLYSDLNGLTAEDLETIQNEGISVLLKNHP